MSKRSFVKAGNANQVCRQLNSQGMAVEAMEVRNGSIHCVGVETEDTRELKPCQGPAATVMRDMEVFDRTPEHWCIQGHFVTAYYRYDEKKEKEVQKKIDDEKKKRESDAKKAEDDAKKKEYSDKIKELEAKRDEVDKSESKPEQSEKKPDKKSNPKK